MTPDGTDGDRSEFYDPRRDAEIAATLRSVVTQEGPIVAELAARRVGELWGYAHLKSKGIERVIVSTYQAVSGAGVMAIRELEAQMAAHAAGDPLPPPDKMPHTILSECLPHIGDFRDDLLTPLAKVIRENNVDLDGLIVVLQKTMFDALNPLGLVKDNILYQDGVIDFNDIVFDFLDPEGTRVFGEDRKETATSLQFDMNLG